MFGDIHSGLSSLMFPREWRIKRAAKQHRPLIIDEPIWDGVKPGRGGLCPNISARESGAPTLPDLLHWSFPPPICSTIADPIHHFGGETRQQAEEGNKGVGGVYWFGFWSLIECLEDKPGDIRYPSGQRMGG